MSWFSMGLISGFDDDTMHIGSRMAFPKDNKNYIAWGLWRMGI